MISPDLLPALQNFAAVAQHGGFRAAARHLGVSPSTLSQTVAGLEGRLGMQLLVRTTRSVSLTREGKLLMDGLTPGFDRITEALDAARGLSASVAGALRLTAPRSLARMLVMPMLVPFARAYPQVSVELQADDALQDIVAAGFDFGLRFGDVLEGDMTAVAIGPETRLLTIAAPDYLERHGRPDRPDQLPAHRCLGRRFPSGAQHVWTFSNGDRQYSFTPDPGLLLNDDQLIVSAVEAGAGIGIAFQQLAQDGLASGRLVEILPDWRDPAERCYLFWAHGRQMRPAMRAFIDFAKGFRA